MTWQQKVVAALSRTGGLGGQMKMDHAQGDRIIDLLETLVVMDDIGDRLAGGVAGVGGVDSVIDLK